MKDKDIVIGMIGRGGDGVLAVGEILVHAVASLGLWALQLKSFGAQIRGGESSCKIRISNEPVQSQGDTVEMLITFNWADYKKFATEFILDKEVLILYPETDPTPADQIPLDASYRRHMHQLPFERLSQEAVGGKWAKNMVTLGIIAAMLGLPARAFAPAIRNKFKKKGTEVQEKNIKAFQHGYDYIESQGEFLEDKQIVQFQIKPGGQKVVLTGNDAFALGALHAGAEFFAGYPITPSTEIMEFMSRELISRGGCFVQTEDEIAAVAMCIGASFAGRRAFTATSGPGVSLMMEGIGLACISELPLVIINVQRGGPSTGIPTKTEQGDLGQAIFGCHGDAPKVVIAPADVRDCFNCAVLAFYIAEKFQIPVLVLSDQFIGHRVGAIERDHFILGVEEGHFQPNTRRRTPSGDELENYVRYRITEDGVSPCSWPGLEKGMYLASGIVHDENGVPSARVDIHNQQNEKRYRKFHTLRKELEFLRHYGPEDAQVALTCWGSTKGVVKEAVLRWNETHERKVKAMVPQIIYPCPVEKMTRFLEPVKKLLVIEMSYSSQFLKYLRTFLDLPRDCIHHKRSGGAPFTVGEITRRIEEAMQ